MSFYSELYGKEPWRDLDLNDIVDVQTLKDPISF